MSTVYQPKEHTKASNKKRRVEETAENVGIIQELKEALKEVKETKQKLKETAERFAKLEKIIEHYAEGSTKKIDVEREECSEKAKARQTESHKAKESHDNEDEVFSDDDKSFMDDSDPWYVKFKQLRKYRIINGDCKVSEHGADRQLGKWVTNQKLAYSNLKKGKKGYLITTERINALESIGFSWGKAYPDPVPWEKKFEDLQKFKNAMGNCDVHINVNNPSSLAKWVSAQRVEYKRFRKGRDSLLTLEQIGQLKEIGFNFKGPRLA